MEEQLTVAGLVDAYLAWRKRYNAKPSTIRTLRTGLGDFAEWAGDRDPASITGQQLDYEYLAAWQARFEAASGRTYKPRCVAERISQLRLFFGWALRAGHLPADPTLILEAPDWSPPRINWLRADQDHTLLAAAKTPREVTVINLFRFTGMRSSEACTLLNRDVVLAQSPDYPWGYIEILDSKTDSGVRVIPIFPELRPIHWQWKSRQIVRGLGAEDLPFLASKNGRAPRIEDNYNLVARVGKRAGVKCSPHTLRRTFGSSILNQDWTKLIAVSAALGHKSTTITQRSYAALEQATLARALLS